MSPDIKAAHLLLKEEKVWNAVRAHIDNYHASQTVETRVFSPTTYSFGEERPRVSETAEAAAAAVTAADGSGKNGNGAAAVVASGNGRSSKRRPNGDVSSAGKRVKN